ncbi:MAG TPA: transglutaminaseTgpA domain-containing protein, partial [Anaerolineae bacterium]|nr:transglutaminaseTgpA domain-containing protein [Anaerolineae bacterium]
MLNSPRDRLIEVVKQHWLTVVPVIGLIASVLVSVSEATWYPEAEPLIVLVLGGAVYGALLAASRLRQRTALIMSVAVSIGVTLIAVGRIVPTLDVWLSSPLANSATIMNLRLFALLDQLARGLLQFRAETLPGRQVLIVAYGLLVWHAAAWLMWSIGRPRRALSGVLACALPLAINIIAAGKAASLPMVFMVCGVILIARTAYLDQTRGWEIRRIGYPELVGEDWTYSVVIISIAVLMLAGLTTPEWQASLKRFFDSFKPPTVAVQPVTPLTTLQSGTPPGGFVPDLSVVGDPIPPDSNATIFWVTLDDAAPRIGAGGELQSPDRTHYWRGGIFGTYTGRGWEPIGVEDQPRSPTATITDTIAPPGRYALRQSFDIIALHADQLFAVNDPITSSARVRSIATGDSAVLRGLMSVYTVTS